MSFIMLKWSPQRTVYNIYQFKNVVSILELSGATLWNPPKWEVYIYYDLDDDTYKFKRSNWNISIINTI